MTDTRGEGRPEDGADSDPNVPPQARDDDARSDIEQAVEARADAVKRGDGGPEPETFTDTGLHDGIGGTGGETRNQDLDQQ